MAIFALITFWILACLAGLAFVAGCSKKVEVYYKDGKPVLIHEGEEINFEAKR